MKEDIHTVVHVRLGASCFPFGVMLGRRFSETSIMLAQARKTGLETAFLAPASPQESFSSQESFCRQYTLRWFSPHGEMQLCGAGALAAAQFLFQHHDGEDRVWFDTPAGQLIARQREEQLTVRLPRVALERYTPDPVLLEALGIGMPRGTRVALRHQTVVLCLHTAEQVVELQPNFPALRMLQAPYLGAVITVAPGRSADAVFRYFTPWHGKNESAVAGSALGVLGPYWGRRIGRRTFTSYQASYEGASFPVRVGNKGTWIGAKVAPEK